MIESRAIEARQHVRSADATRLRRRMTGGRWLAANTDLGRLDAELLLGQVLNMSRAQVIAFPETALTGAQSHRLNRLADRRRGGEPLAYLLGRKEFYGLSFRVGAEVLVPRPETELLVELALRYSPRDGRVVDLGTGSGCIAVALKHHRPDLRVAATDISFPALKTASENATAHAVNVAMLQGDWLSGLRGPFDCIVANPPYIAPGDGALAELESEPRGALVADASGLGAIHRIIEQARSRLASCGRLILEHGCPQAPAVRNSLASVGFHNIQTHHDLADLERATVATMKSP